jgi:hypothetical protein
MTPGALAARCHDLMRGPSRSTASTATRGRRTCDAPMLNAMLMAPCVRCDCHRRRWSRPAEPGPGSDDAAVWFYRRASRHRMRRRAQRSHHLLGQTSRKGASRGARGTRTRSQGKRRKRRPSNRAGGAAKACDVATDEVQSHEYRLSARQRRVGIRETRSQWRHGMLSCDRFAASPIEQHGLTMPTSKRPSHCRRLS